MHFVEQNINFNKIETESKMENPAHNFNEPVASVHIRIAN